VERRVSGNDGVVQRPLRHTLRSAQARWAPRRLLLLGTYLLGAWLLTVPLPAQAQAQSEIQYTYDAAGNVIGVTRTSAPKPDLTVTNLSVGIITAVGNGSFSFPVAYQVNNVGSTTAVASWYDRGYLSGSATLHDTDQVLGGSTTHSTNLAAGAGYTVNTIFTTSTTTIPGTWTLIVKADGGTSSSGQYTPTGPNYVDEFNEFNNSQAVTINLPANPKPDLTVSNLAVGAMTVNQNGSYNIAATFQINNIGSTSANPTWYDRGYLSSDAVLQDADQILGSYNTRSATLSSAASYTASITFTTSASTPAGSTYLIVKADGGNGTGQYAPTGANYVAEGNEANNAQALSITLPVKPDLAVSNASVGAITMNQNGSYSFPISWTVTNNGGATAAPNWYDVGYLSSNATLDNADLYVGALQHTAALAAGASYTASRTYTTATTTASGTYTLFVKADGRWSGTSGTPTDNGYVAEGNEANNVASVSVVLP
jgi:hypothetical protein